MRVKKGGPLLLLALCLSKATLGTAATTKPLIQIGVEVVEVDEQKSQNLGIQWMSSLNLAESAVPALLKIGSVTRDALTANLQFLEQHGAADLLANPKLVARDGTSADFHAGGELPYATSEALGTVSIQFKTYGVDLKINPHLNADRQIEMSIDAEVSSPDAHNSVTLSGNTVPGIRSRKVSSQLTMEPGSTLTMAGLIQTDKEWTRAGVPGLMHIPLLGYLFSYRTQTNTHSSIVVFVTPTLLGEASAPSPTPSLPTSFKSAPVPIPVHREPDDLLSIEEQKDLHGDSQHG